MDIFKLFFKHDLRLDKLAKRNANKTEEEVEATLDDFMKPIPTYSKFYLTGTRLEEGQFGLNILNQYPDIAEKLNKVCEGMNFHTENACYASFANALEEAPIGHAILITASGMDEPDYQLSELNVDSESNVGHFKEELSEVLLGGHLVAYKEQAHDGYDLHLFSKKNIYTDLFYPLKELVSDRFRFFSINSRRMRSERHFYFETWTLDKPPHGAEEVLPETVL